jgi:hypothetical protein
MYKIQNKETGKRIDGEMTLEEAKEQLAIYEEEDKENGKYVPNFYEIKKQIDLPDEDEGFDYPPNVYELADRLNISKEEAYEQIKRDEEDDYQIEKDYQRMNGWAY